MELILCSKDCAVDQMNTTATVSALCACSSWERRQQSNKYPSNWTHGQCCEGYGGHEIHSRKRTRGDLEARMASLRKWLKKLSPLPGQLRLWRICLQRRRPGSIPGQEDRLENWVAPHPSILPGGSHGWRGTDRADFTVTFQPLRRERRCSSQRSLQSSEMKNKSQQGGPWCVRRRKAPQLPGSKQLRASGPRLEISVSFRGQWEAIKMFHQTSETLQFLFLCQSGHSVENRYRKAN